MIMVNEIIDISKGGKLLFSSGNVNKIGVLCSTGNRFRDESSCKACHEFKCPAYYDENEWIDMLNDAYSFIKSSDAACVTSLQQDGCPFSRTMLSLLFEGFDVMWFGTFLTSQKVTDIKANKNACVLFSDNVGYKSVTLKGEIDIFTDYESKKNIWRDGFERYYPDGINEKDYCALRFTAKMISYYYRIKEWKFVLME